MPDRLGFTPTRTLHCNHVSHTWRSTICHLQRKKRPKSNGALVVFFPSYLHFKMRWIRPCKWGGQTTWMSSNWQPVDRRCRTRLLQYHVVSGFLAKVKIFYAMAKFLTEMPMLYETINQYLNYGGDQLLMISSYYHHSDKTPAHHPIRLSTSPMIYRCTWKYSTPANSRPPNQMKCLLGKEHLQLLADCRFW